jgi:hypothetical protein
LDRGRVAILRVLNQKHHQEGDDGRAGVDDKLPRIRKLKERAGDGPHEDGGEGKTKTQGRPASREVI